MMPDGLDLPTNKIRSHLPVPRQVRGPGWLLQGGEHPSLRGVVGVHVQGVQPAHQAVGHLQRAHGESSSITLRHLLWFGSGGFGALCMCMWPVCTSCRRLCFVVWHLIDLKGVLCFERGRLEVGMHHSKVAPTSAPHPRVHCVHNLTCLLLLLLPCSTCAVLLLPRVHRGHDAALLHLQPHGCGPHAGQHSQGEHAAAGRHVSFTCFFGRGW